MLIHAPFDHHHCYYYEITLCSSKGYFVTLKYPYPRVVNEPIDYEEPVFTEAEENIQTDHLSVVTDKRRLSVRIGIN